MKSGYACNTEAAVALAAGIAKSILGVNGNGAFGVDLLGFKVGFDGITAANAPVVVELCYSTFATNGPGTNSTSVTVDTAYGRSVTPGMTAARNWTAEPTVLTPIDEFLLTPNGGLVIVNIPRDRTPDSAVSNGFVLRCTAPNVVSVRATMTFERG